MAYKRRSKKVNNSPSKQPVPGNSRPIEKEVLYGKNDRVVREQWESDTGRKSTYESDK